MVGLRRSNDINQIFFGGRWWGRGFGGKFPPPPPLAWLNYATDAVCSEYSNTLLVAFEPIDFAIVVGILKMVSQHYILHAVVSRYNIMLNCEGLDTYVSVFRV